MMEMGQVCEQECQQVQIQGLDVNGDMVESLFPRTGELLRKTKYQKAIQRVVSRKRMEPYRDFIDCLFCELIPGFRAACFRYYKGEGKQLMHDPRATRIRIAEWDQFMVTSLKTAVELMKCEEFPSWYSFRQRTRYAFHQAPS